VEDPDRSDNVNSGLIWKILAGAAAMTTVIAMFINVMISFSDMRSTVRDMQAKHQVIEQRLNEVDIRAKQIDSDFSDKLKSLDLSGSRELIVTKAQVAQLQEQIKRLSDTVDNLNEALMAHNNEMINLYRKNRPHP
jgi:chromosome segregation ATPase